MNEFRADEQSIPVSPHNDPWNSSTQPDAPIKSSGLGITSFVISIISFLGLIGVTIATVYIVSDWLDDEGRMALTREELTDKVKPMLGLWLLYPLFSLASVIGLILGIVALRSKNTKKVLSIIGTILNGVVVLVVVGLFLIGILGSIGATS